LPWHVGLVAALFVALTGAMYFADVRMKSEDNCFVGFPAVWQMPLLVFLTFDPPVWLTVAIILLLGLGEFTWLKFIHPVRTVRWRRVNLSVCLLWVVLGAWAVWANFEPPQAVKLGLLAASVWLLVVGIVMQLVPERRAVGAE
jgi:phosphatidylcholine synthase